MKAWAWTVGDAVRGRAAAARVCGWVVVDSLRAALVSAYPEPQEMLDWPRSK